MKREAKGKGTNMVSEGSCFPLQVSVFQYNTFTFIKLVKPLKHHTNCSKNKKIKTLTYVSWIVVYNNFSGH